MSFLGLEGRAILVTGVANKRSIAYRVHCGLVEAGARVIHAVRDQETRDAVGKLLEPAPIHVCDVSRPDDIARLAESLEKPLHGLVHSIAFASYAGGEQPFHATQKQDFLEAFDVSCYSLVALSNALARHFAVDASVVAMSISTTSMAAESYGYMAPIKAALDSAVVFLAKSFSAFSEVRFNAVKAGPLKTSASAGIPRYLDNYLFAEAATLRHRALATDEVANTALFLLSPRSSGINAQGLVVDAGMGVNYFDRAIVARVSGGAAP
jgi:enoyl-[acyl-carrier protein] reductase I